MATPGKLTGSFLHSLLTYLWHPLRTVLIVLISGLCFLSALCFPLCCLLLIDRLYSDSCARLIYQVLRCRRGGEGEEDRDDDAMLQSDLRYGRFGGSNDSIASSSMSINDSVV